MRRADSVQRWHSVTIMDQAIYDSLTPMERNCLRLAQHDRKSEQIGHLLGIAASTVNTHIFAARRKLGGVSRLSAADQLRGFETHSADREGLEQNAPDSGPAAPPQSMSKQAMSIGGPGADGPSLAPLTDVREERAAFVFDDASLQPGQQEQKRDETLSRVVLLLAIAALGALIVIAAPAIYDSAAQRIANSLERPHER